VNEDSSEANIIISYILEFLIFLKWFNLV